MRCSAGASDMTRARAGFNPKFDPIRFLKIFFLILCQPFKKKKRAPRAALGRECVSKVAPVPIILLSLLDIKKMKIKIMEDVRSQAAWGFFSFLLYISSSRQGCIIPSCVYNEEHLQQENNGCLDYCYYDVCT